MKTNIIYNQDCLDLMKSLPKESIDLIYIDPPFFTQQDFGQFNDKWNDIQFYLDYMKLRLIEMHRLLKSNGVLCVHLDYKSVHYIKVCLDKLFGYGNPDKGAKHLVNEIIWCYSNSGRSSKGFCKKHDTILIYGKTKNFFWNNYKIPVSEKYLKSHYKKKDINGEKCIIRVDAGKERIYYAKDGMSCNDWWSDIPSVNSMANERVGYPTQKPLKLLDRLIKAFTKEGDLVGDFFSGSGTTLVSAYNNNRKYIGCDINKNAIKIANKRLQQLSLYDNKE